MSVCNHRLCDNELSPLCPCLIWAQLVQQLQTVLGGGRMCQHFTPQRTAPFGFCPRICGWWDYYWPVACCQLWDVIFALQETSPAQKAVGSTCPPCDATGSLRRRLRGPRPSIHAERLREVVWHLPTAWSCKTSSTSRSQCESYEQSCHHVVLLPVFHLSRKADIVWWSLCFCLGKPPCGFGWSDWGERGLSRLGLWSQGVLHGGPEPVRGGALRWPWARWDTGGEHSVQDDPSTSVKKTWLVKTFLTNTQHMKSPAGNLLDVDNTCFCDYWIWFIPSSCRGFAT